MDASDKFLMQWFRCTENLIELLKVNGNVCNDWSRVVFHSENQAIVWSSRIKNCTFSVEPHGFIAFLERWNESSTYHFEGRPAGVYNTTLVGTCVVCAGCRIADTDLMSHVVVYPGALVQSCGEVVAHKNPSGKSSKRGNGTKVNVGPENGGRTIEIFAGMGYASACEAAMAHRRTAWNTLTTNDNELLGGGDSMTLVLSKAVLKRCPKIANCYIGPSSIVEAAYLDNCTLNSESSRPVKVQSFANVSNSILEANSSVRENSVVTSSYLTETASVSTGATLNNVILGPDSSIAIGECHHSLIGPFVGFHHQALLIAALWPLGRGNIAYGSMLGSNHTGKVNDQECWIGEGCFFGLGVAVKYPCNFLASPYTLFASKCVINPMKLAYPFSLVLPDTNNSNRLIIKPGWVLHSNPYMIERAMKKLKTRRKSVQHNTNQPIFRKSIVELVRISRDSLVEHKVGPIDLGRWAHIQGTLDVVEGYRAYTDFIRRYALHGAEVIELYFSNYGPDSSMENIGLGIELNRPERSGEKDVALVLEDVSGYDDQTQEASWNYSSGTRTWSKFLVLLFPDPQKAQARLNNLKSEIVESSILTDTALSTVVHQWEMLSIEYPELIEAFEEEFKPLLSEEFSTSLVSTEIQQIWDRLFLQLRKHLYELERDYATLVRDCKFKDDERGHEIIPDYREINISSQEQEDDMEGLDSVMRDAHRRAQDLWVDEDA